MTRRIFGTHFTRAPARPAAAEVASWQRRWQIAEARLAGASQEEAEARFPKLEFDVLDITFDAIGDPAERQYFMNLPTSFVLKEEDVDRLRAVAGELLRQSPVYQEFLTKLNAERVD